jgi:phosphatidylserine/phosphatidylglycerophosphate/cardiolipin synthase-like enzyme
MDLTTLQGDRLDASGHPLRFGPNWHDAQVRLEGPVVSDVEANFCQRWNAAAGSVRLEPLPRVQVPIASGHPAQIVRTVPRGIYPFAPEGEFGIYHALVEAIGQAKRFVYLENQYLWCPEIVDALTQAMNRRHPDPFRIVVVLPARAYTGRYDNDAHVRLLTQVDGGRGMFHAYALYTAGSAIGRSGYRYAPIYVHAKVSVVDDEWFSIGSANLNRRGLATDTEMNVQSIAPEVARDLREQLWSEHLDLPLDQVRKADPVDLIDRVWPARAEALLAALQVQAVPPPGQVVPYLPSGNPYSRAMDLLQEWTVEH